MAFEYVSPEFAFNRCVDKISTALRDAGYVGEIVGDYPHGTVETEFGVVRLNYNIAAYNKKSGKLFSDFPRSFYSYFNSVAPFDGDRDAAMSVIGFLAGKHSSPWGKIMAA